MDNGTIYEPAEDSRLLQQYVREFAFGRVLDMGTGSGIQALTALQKPAVREVIAVDINHNAVLVLQEKINRENLRKISALQSDLFAKVSGKFNLIVFNPPYLPQDKGIVDPALYGGRKGWELSLRFFREVSPFLFPEGKILFLFSSLTNKEKIDALLRDHLFEFTLLEQKKLLFFEELYVYEIRKSSLLRALEQRGVERIEFFDKGKRGVVFTGILDRSKLVKTHFPLKKDILKVAIKIHREGSEAQERIANEATWLRMVNEKGVGPRYLFEGEHYVAYEFVEGTKVRDWMNDHSPAEIVVLLQKVLHQCYTLDQLGVNKEEMHHPTKHIIITPAGEAVLIDFERCVRTEHPKNVTQFTEFICKVARKLSELGRAVPIPLLRKAARNYKEHPTGESFRVISSLIKGGL